MKTVKLYDLLQVHRTSHPEGKKKPSWRTCWQHLSAKGAREPLAGAISPPPTLSAVLLTGSDLWAVPGWRIHSPGPWAEQGSPANGGRSGEQEWWGSNSPGIPCDLFSVHYFPLSPSCPHCPNKFPPPLSEPRWLGLAKCTARLRRKCTARLLVVCK